MADLFSAARAANVSRAAPLVFTLELARESVQRKGIIYDSGDTHYDCASALIKSIRGSDADAGLYWLARMLEGGEDVRFLSRRLVILASEDIGNADPRSLMIAVAALQATEFALQFSPDRRVEGRERLVQQQHFGPVAQRLRQRHSLALSARDLGGIAILQAGESQVVQPVGRGAGR